jgi:serine/threonine protein kinase
MTPRTASRYEVEAPLGRGGMASVHLARQRALGRKVAPKELHSVDDPDSMGCRHRQLPQDTLGRSKDGGVFAGDDERVELVHGIKRWGVSERDAGARVEVWRLG